MHKPLRDCLTPLFTHTHLMTHTHAQTQMQLQPLRAAWLSHPDLQLVLERCLTRKPPSSDDLRALLPRLV